MSDKTEAAGDATPAKTTASAGTAARAAKAAAGESKPEVLAPVAWVKDPASDKVFAVASPSEYANLLAHGYTDTEAPEGMPEAERVPGMPEPQVAKEQEAKA